MSDSSASAIRIYDGRPWTPPELSTTSIVDQLAASAQRHETNIALVELNESGDEVATIDYRTLIKSVTARARALGDHGAHGLRVVGVPMSNTIAALIDLFAVLQLGCVAVIVDVAEPTDRREEQFGQLVQAVVRVGQDNPPLEVRTPELAEIGKDEHPTAFVLYTTGSTAASKPVAQSHHAVLTNVIATIRHHSMRSGETMVCPLPASHVNGLHFGVLATLLSGGTCVLLHRSDPLVFLRGLNHYRAARSTTVPSLLQAVGELRRWPLLPTLKYFVSAAAALGPDTARAVYAQGHRIVQGYGLSECMNFATTMPIALDTPTYEASMLERAIPPVGHSIGGCEVAVLSTDGVPQGLGAVGEVVVRGDSLMSRYIGDTTATTEALGSGWLCTGDLGHIDLFEGIPEPVLTLIGRRKNVAKCGGLSISLEEMDRWLEQHPKILEACCVTRRDVLRGEAVTAHYVARPGVTLHVEDVEAHLNRRFNAHVVGLRLIGMERLPRLRSGKLDRRALARVL